MSHIFVEQMQEEVQCEGVYILKEHHIRIAKNNKPYLQIVVADKTGEISGFMFNTLPDNLKLIDGDMVWINFKKQIYNDKENLFVNAIRTVDSTMIYDKADYVQVSEIPAEVFVNEMYETVASFKNKDFYAVGMRVLDENKEALLNIPGGKSVHHDCLGGLALHTGSMLRIAKCIADVYKGFINRELFLLGVIIHDIKKVDEFDISPLGLVTDYTTRGKLLGHIAMGSEYIGKICDELGADENVKTVLQHMILSHHGQPEYGSAIKPMVMEAYLLHAVDMIDSRIHIYNKAVNNIEANGFSDKQFVLDGIQVFNHNF